MSDPKSKLFRPWAALPMQETSKGTNETKGTKGPKDPEERRQDHGYLPPVVTFADRAGISVGASTARDLGHPLSDLVLSLHAGHCPASGTVGLQHHQPLLGYGHSVHSNNVYSEHLLTEGQGPTNPLAKVKKQRPKRFPCPHCQVAFSNNGQLKGHVRIHTGERPFPCDFPDCGKTFTRNEELTRHKRIHLGLRPYACQVCGKKFGRKDHLKKHVKTHQQKVALPGALLMGDPTCATMWPPTAYYHPGYVLGMQHHGQANGMFNMAAGAECGPFIMQWTT